MSGFEVDTTAMRAHASKVAGLVGKADQAKDAAAEVSFHPDAFGTIGAALVYPLLAPLEVAGRGATELASEALSATSDGINGMADAYDFVDASVEGFIRKIKGAGR